ncbi:MAG: hypothetical protein WC454_06095 [Phycisphaerae bacterium]|jgi:hypothetical protein
MLANRFKVTKKTKGKYATAHESAIPPTNKLHPAFCFRYLAPGSFPQEQRQKAAVANTLYKLGRLSWGEIQIAPREGVGHEIISITSLRQQPPINLSPDTAILAFRCTEGGRMIGYREDKIFYIFWFDFSPFTVYDHGS